MIHHSYNLLRLLARYLWAKKHPKIMICENTYKNNIRRCHPTRNSVCEKNSFSSTAKQCNWFDTLRWKAIEEVFKKAGARIIYFLLTKTLHQH